MTPGNFPDNLNFDLSWICESTQKRSVKFFLLVYFLTRRKCYALRGLFGILPPCLEWPSSFYKFGPKSYKIAKKWRAYFCICFVEKCPFLINLFIKINRLNILKVIHRILCDQSFNICRHEFFILFTVHKQHLFFKSGSTEYSNINK